MKLAIYEWRKLAALPALWVFLALCLAFNGLLMAGHLPGRELFQAAGQVTEQLGQRVDRDFLAGLEDLPQTPYKRTLQDTAAGMENIYASFDLDELTAFYQHQVRKSPLAVSWMTWKYSLLEGRVDHLARTGAALDFYAGPVTHDSHQFLFGTLLRAVTGEGAILGMLAVLRLLGCEEASGTQAMVCTSRTGRGLYRTKILVGVIAAVGFYVLLTALTLGVYLLLWDHGGMWSASVSSQLNYIVDLLYKKPFLTWADFTLGQYLAASVLLGGLLTGVFALLAAPVGLLIRNTYLAALVLMLLVFLPMAAASALGELGLWAAYFVVGLAPTCLWLQINGWFTELGLGAFLPWQETIGTAGNLLLLALLTAWVLRRFRRKDVTA